MKSYKIKKAIINLKIEAVIKSFYLKELNHYESSCLYKLMNLCVSRLLEEG